jgi:hypothetical protein
MYVTVFMDHSVDLVLRGPHRMLATVVKLAAKCLCIVAAVILSHNKSELHHYRQSGGKCPGKSGARPHHKVALQCPATCMSPLRLFKAIFAPRNLFVVGHQC